MQIHIFATSTVPLDKVTTTARFYGVGLLLQGVALFRHWHGHDSGKPTPYPL